MNNESLNSLFQLIENEPKKDKSCGCEKVFAHMIVGELKDSNPELDLYKTRLLTYYQAIRNKRIKKAWDTIFSNEAFNINA